MSKQESISYVHGHTAATLFIITQKVAREYTSITAVSLVLGIELLHQAVDSMVSLTSGSGVATDGNRGGRLGENTVGINVSNIDLDRAKVTSSKNSVGPRAI